MCHQLGRWQDDAGTWVIFRHINNAQTDELHPTVGVHWKRRFVPLLLKNFATGFGRQNMASSLKAWHFNAFDVNAPLHLNDLRAADWVLVVLLACSTVTFFLIHHVLETEAGGDSKQLLVLPIGTKNDPPQRNRWTTPKKCWKNPKLWRRSTRLERNGGMDWMVMMLHAKVRGYSVTTRVQWFQLQDLQGDTASDRCRTEKVPFISTPLTTNPIKVGPVFELKSANAKRVLLTFYTFWSWWLLGGRRCMLHLGVGADNCGCTGRCWGVWCPGCDGLFLEGRFDRVSAFPGERRLIGELWNMTFAGNTWSVGLSHQLVGVHAGSCVDKCMWYNYSIRILLCVQATSTVPDCTPDCL